MKITVKNTNRDLVFFPDTKIRIQKHSPLFHELGDFSFPFDIPLEENNRALDYPARLTRYGLTRFDVDVLIQSHLLPDKDGVLTITPYSDKLSCSLLLGKGSLNNRLKNTNLKDALDHTIDIGDSHDLNSHIHYVISDGWPQFPYNFPVIKADDDYYDSANPDFKGRINYYEPLRFPVDAHYTYVLPNYVEPIFPSGKHANNWTTINPFLYISEIITRIFQHLNIKLNTAVTHHAGLSKLLLWNNHPLDKMPFAIVRSETASPVPIAQEYLPGAIVTQIPADELLDETSIYASNQYQFKNGGDYSVRLKGTYNAADAEVSQLIFFMYKNGVQWQTLANISINNSNPSLINFAYTANIFIAEFSEPSADIYDIRVGVVYGGNSFSAGHTVDLSIDLWSKKTLNSFSESINLKNHVPDISCLDFLAEFENLFGFKTFPNNDSAEMIFFKDIVNASIHSDLSKYRLKGHQVNELQNIAKYFFSGFTDELPEFEITQSVNAFADLASDFRPNKLAFVKALNMYYISAFDDNYSTDWTLLDKYFPPIIIQDDGREIASQIVPIAVTRDIVNTQPVDLNTIYGTSGSYDPTDMQPWEEAKHDGIIPIAPDKVNSPPFNVKNNMTLRIMNYLGLRFFEGQNEVDGLNYPQASNSNRDSNGVLIPDAISLNTESIFNEFWADYVAYHNQLEIVKQDYALPDLVLLSLDFSKKYMENGVEFLISQIDFEFDIATDEIKQPVTLTLAVKK